MNRLGAAARDAPRREIEAGDVGVLHAPYGQVVREIRREADGRAIARDGAEPFDGPFDECLRRHDDGVGPHVHRADRDADQAHVVIERQPADRDVLARRADAVRPAERRDVRREISMRDDDAFRGRRRSRRELHEGNVVSGRRLDCGRRFERMTLQDVRRRHDRESGARGTERLDEAAGERAGRDHRPRADGTQHAARERQVPIQIAGPRRRIERRRNHTGDRRAEQRREKRFGVADDDGDEIAAAEAQCVERGRHAERRRVNIGIGPAGFRAARPDKPVSVGAAGRRGKRFWKRRDEVHHAVVVSLMRTVT